MKNTVTVAVLFALLAVAFADRHFLTLSEEETKPKDDKGEEHQQSQNDTSDEDEALRSAQNIGKQLQDIVRQEEVAQRAREEKGKNTFYLSCQVGSHNPKNAEREDKALRALFEFMGSKLTTDKAVIQDVTTKFKPSTELSNLMQKINTNDQETVDGEWDQGWHLKVWAKTDYQAPRARDEITKTPATRGLLTLEVGPPGGADFEIKPELVLKKKLVLHVYDGEVYSDARLALGDCNIAKSPTPTSCGMAGTGGQESSQDQQKGQDEEGGQDEDKGEQEGPKKE